VIEIQEFAPRKLAMTLTGQIDARDVEAIEKILGPYLEDEGAVNAMIDMTGLSAPSTTDQRSLDARILAQLDKVGRLAIVTGGKGFGAALKVCDAIMPPGAFKRFAPEHRGEARAFIS